MVEKNVIWGCGNLLQREIKNLDPEMCVEYVVDTDARKHGKIYTERELICKSPDEIEKGYRVIICIYNDDSYQDVTNYLDERNITYCSIYDVIDEYRAKLLLKYKYENRFSDVIIDKDKIVKYISCSVPIFSCNFRCPYCYLENHDANIENRYIPSADYIERALSPERIGGIALINFCAAGETMLWSKLMPIVEKMVNAGHYVSIVTNGTISKAFQDLLELNVDFNHIFIKFSFHYLELKRLNLLDRFVENVTLCKNAGMSFSVELVASDIYVPHIDEIKSFSIEKFGAMPQVTVPRNESDNYNILTEMNEKEYYKLWSSFNSPMFDYKYRNLDIKRGNCMAGVYSWLLDIETGDLMKCVGNATCTDNIYTDITKSICEEAVYDSCCLPYCYNCHAYISFGVIPNVNAISYYDVRDRETADGIHWVTYEMKKIFEQRICNNQNLYSCRE